MKKAFSSKNISSKEPDWYWEKKGGFHDAQIIGLNFIEMDYNNTEAKPIRNYCEIILNLVVKHSIKLYNYKMINGDFHIGNWWLGDTLDFTNNKFLLKIITCDDNNNEAVVSVQFDYAETNRQ